MLPFSITSITTPHFRGINGMLWAVFLKQNTKLLGDMMDLDKSKIITQDATGEPAPIDQVEERVEAAMKKLKGEARKLVADGLQDEELARQGEQLKEEGERELKEANNTE
jgi:hypothetical protein